MALGNLQEEPSAGKPHARICEGESRMAELLDHSQGRRSEGQEEQQDQDGTHGGSPPSEPLHPRLPFYHGRVAFGDRLSGSASFFL